MITKGAVDEMLSVCSFAEYKEQIQPLTDDIRKEIMATVDSLNENGMRVIAIAQKEALPTVDTYSVRDEGEMVLMGYLAFRRQRPRDPLYLQTGGHESEQSAPRFRRGAHE